MKHEATASLLNLDNKYIHSLAIIIFSLLIATTLIIHAYKIYSEIHISESNQYDHTNKTTAKVIFEKNLNINDYQLLFGSNNFTKTIIKQKDIPTTRLNLTLHGSLVSLLQTTESSAIIQSNNQDKVYQIGDKLPGGGVLVEVHSDHIVLKINNQLEKLSFPNSGSDDKGLLSLQDSFKNQPYKNIEAGYTEQPRNDSIDNRMRLLREQLQKIDQGN
ncbi:MAG: type II secretion system protein N [Endozoicomonas sp. (ex Botrylloides leachii)]|nr:type II secretion system protein N [Endozoicomonas sp. (ex Botrylloides leachii)]